MGKSPIIPPSVSGRCLVAGKCCVCDHTLWELFVLILGVEHDFCIYCMWLRITFIDQLPGKSSSLLYQFLVSLPALWFVHCCIFANKHQSFKFLIFYKFCHCVFYEIDSSSDCVWASSSDTRVHLDEVSYSDWLSWISRRGAEFHSHCLSTPKQLRTNVKMELRTNTTHTGAKSRSFIASFIISPYRSGTDSSCGLMFYNAYFICGSSH